MHRLIGITWLLLILTCTNAIAMDMTTLTLEFDGVARSFITIERGILKTITNRNLPTSWQFGQRHASYFLLWAQKNSLVADKTSINGARQYGPPHELVHILNDHLKPQQRHFIAEQKNRISENELFQIIKSDIDANRPLSVYVDNNGMLSMITILGYENKANNDPHVLVLPHCASNHRPQAMSIENLRLMMDCSLWQISLDDRIKTLASEDTSSPYLPIAETLRRQVSWFNIIRFQPRVEEKNTDVKAENRGRSSSFKSGLQKTWSHSR